MAKCGTIAGYMFHKRRGETTCLECKAEWRRYYAERRKRNDASRSEQSESISRP